MTKKDEFEEIVKKLYIHLEPKFLVGKHKDVITILKDYKAQILRDFLSGNELKALISLLEEPSSRGFLSTLYKLKQLSKESKR